MYIDIYVYTAMYGKCLGFARSGMTTTPSSYYLNVKVKVNGGWKLHSSPSPKLNVKSYGGGNLDFSF